MADKKVERKAVKLEQQLQDAKLRIKVGPAKFAQILAERKAKKQQKLAIKREVIAQVKAQREQARQQRELEKTIQEEYVVVKQSDAPAHVEENLEVEMQVDA